MCILQLQLTWTHKDRKNVQGCKTLKSAAKAEEWSTVEPPNKGHFGNGPFVLSSEVVPISEVDWLVIVKNACGGYFNLGVWTS